MKYCTILLWSLCANIGFALFPSSLKHRNREHRSRHSKRSCEFFINGIHLRFSEGLSGDVNANTVHFLFWQKLIAFFHSLFSLLSCSFHSILTPTHLFISTNCLQTILICYFSCSYITACMILREKYWDWVETRWKSLKMTYEVVQFRQKSLCNSSSFNFNFSFILISIHHLLNLSKNTWVSVKMFKYQTIIEERLLWRKNYLNRIATATHSLTHTHIDCVSLTRNGLIINFSEETKKKAQTIRIVARSLMCFSKKNIWIFFLFLL